MRFAIAAVVLQLRVARRSSRVVGDAAGSPGLSVMEGLVCLLTPSRRHGVALCLPLVLQEANVYMIDEPSSYLDVRQRLKAAKVRL